LTTTEPVSGAIATKEDVQAFADSCVLLWSQWMHFVTLFKESDLKRELLQTTAPTFFGDLNRLLIEHLVLHVCRLTDEAQTMGRKNLTVKFLIGHSDWSNAPDILAKLKSISNSIHEFRKRILPARKWFVAHLDLSAVRLQEPLGAASDAEWKQFWLDLQNFLDVMFRHHVDPDSRFYLSEIAGVSDADWLLTSLRNAKLFEAVINDRESGTRALSAAEKSKFAAQL
jgi:AbiU2